MRVGARRRVVRSRDELAELVLGGECVDEGLDDVAVGGGHPLDELEVREEVLVAQLRAGVLVGGAGDEEVPGDAEGVGHAREDVGGGDGALVLVAADLGVVDAGGAGEVELGEAAGEAGVAEALAEGHVRGVRRG